MKSCFTICENSITRLLRGSNVKRISETVVLLPVDGARDIMAEALGAFSEDLAIERNELPMDVREGLRD